MKPRTDGALAEVIRGALRAAQLMPRADLQQHITRIAEDFASLDGVVSEQESAQTAAATRLINGDLGALTAQPGPSPANAKPKAEMSLALSDAVSAAKVLLEDHPERYSLIAEEWQKHLAFAVEMTKWNPRVLSWLPDNVRSKPLFWKLAFAGAAPADMRPSQLHEVVASNPRMMSMMMAKDPRWFTFATGDAAANAGLQRAFFRSVNGGNVPRPEAVSDDLKNQVEFMERLVDYALTPDWPMDIPITDDMQVSHLRLLLRLGASGYLDAMGSGRAVAVHNILDNGDPVHLRFLVQCEADDVLSSDENCVRFVHRWAELMGFDVAELERQAAAEPRPWEYVVRRVTQAFVQEIKRIEVSGRDRNGALSQGTTQRGDLNDFLTVAITFDAESLVLQPWFLRAQDMARTKLDGHLDATDIIDELDELKRQRPDEFAHLAKRVSAAGMRWILRFSDLRQLHQALAGSEKADVKHAPLYLVAGPMADHNGAFHSVTDTVLPALQEKGRTLYADHATLLQLVEYCERETAKAGKKFSQGVICGHGDRLALHLMASTAEGDCSIDGDDTELLRRLGRCFAKDAELVLISCSTGEGESTKINLANIVANATGLPTTAPPIPANIRSLSATDNETVLTPKFWSRSYRALPGAVPSRADQARRVP